MLAAKPCLAVLTPLGQIVVKTNLRNADGHIDHNPAAQAVREAREASDVSRHRFEVERLALKFEPGDGQGKVTRKSIPRIGIGFERAYPPEIEIANGARKLDRVRAAKVGDLGMPVPRELWETENDRSCPRQVGIERARHQKLPLARTALSVLVAAEIEVKVHLMARNQKNFDNFLYVDDNGDSWTKRGESGGDATAVDGHATGTNDPSWIESSRMKVRRIIYQDPTTFRTVTPIFYTAAAFAAVALGDILAVQVEGLATTVNYAATKKVAEKQPSRGPSRKLADT